MKSTTGVVYIYSLRSPDNNVIKYVGKSINPKRRFYQHIFNARHSCKDNIHLSRWIRKILSENKKPVLEIVETCNEKNWKEREKYWIAHFKENKLCNKSAGGIEPPNCAGRKLSKEQRKAISDRKKGVPIWNNGTPHPMLGKLGKDNPNFGKKRSKEFCELMRKQKLENNGMRGKKLSEERIEQIRKQKSKKVALIDDCGKVIKIFNSQKEASHELNIYSGGISRVCNGEYTHVKGYKFKWV